MPGTHEINSSECIVEFADAIVVLAFAEFGTAKIESQDLEIRTDKGARQRVCNLVVHGATVLRVRVTDDRSASQCSLPGSLEDGFKPAHGALEKQIFGDGVFRHGGFRCKIMALWMLW